MLNIKIKKLNKNVQLPKQSTQGAAGMDFTYRSQYDLSQIFLRKYRSA